MTSHHMGGLNTAMNSQEEEFSKYCLHWKGIIKEEENRKYLTGGEEELGAELPGLFRSEQGK